MSDVKLIQTNDDGDVVFDTGDLVLAPGLETAAYLSLFGGNEDDDGSADSTKQWWGNIGEQNPSRQYRSETQYLLRSLPAVSSNLRRLEDAALRDLAWLLNDRVASSVAVSARIPGVNRVELTINIEAVGEESSFSFVANWRAEL